MSLERIQKELNDINKDSPENFSISVPYENYPLFW